MSTTTRRPTAAERKMLGKLRRDRITARTVKGDPAAVRALSGKRR